ncbi:MAG: hypothetical protein H0W44_10325 [Gammaproteobacteria bacterium]|nr:hypothetical protein [Gammaproteobacteria bacterium]
MSLPIVELQNVLDAITASDTPLQTLLLTPHLSNTSNTPDETHLRTVLRLPANTVILQHNDPLNHWPTTAPEIYDLAMILDLDLYASDLVNTLIAHLRDRACRQLLVALSVNADQHAWTTRLLSLGLSGINTASHNIYEFNISHYKTVPDWLNSKHWANPEHWNKHRW